MANSILSTKFSSYFSTRQLNESRLQRLKDPDKNKATYMGLWDKFKDLFLTDKKQDALNAMHDAIHGNTASDKLEAFDTLKSCAGQTSQDRFTKQIDDDEKISLLIDKDLVTTCSVKEALYINDDVSMRPMTTDEKKLFLKTLDVVKEKDRTIVDAQKNMVGVRRDAVRKEIKDDLNALYRPAEKPLSSNVEWKGDEINGSLDELKCLNMGNGKPHTLFHKVGYQYNPIMESVEFRMVHPTISYLLGQYVNADEMAAKFDQEKEDIMLKNSSYLNLFNEDYETYQSNKPAVDSMLEEVYQLHGDTLCITVGGECRNHL